MDQDLLTRARFFLEYGGYCTPPGRVACALGLARAEQRAKEIGLDVLWEDEDYPWDGEGCEPPTIWAHAYIKDPSGGFLASLGGIGLDSMHDPYVRVIEAELFDEALTTIDAENERTWSRAANELMCRATFAG